MKLINNNMEESNTLKEEVTKKELEDFIQKHSTNNYQYYINKAYTSVKKSIWRLIEGRNPWDTLKIRDKTLWKRFPILPKQKWFDAFESFSYDFRGKDFSSIVGFLHFSRIPTNDCLFEVPTEESLTLLDNLLKNSKTILAPFCGLALYEKLLSIRNHYIVAIDSYVSHSTGNQNCRQMSVYNVSFEEGIKKYTDVDTLLCIWTPSGLDVLSLVSEYNHIKTVIFVGEPELCGCFSSEDIDKIGYLHEDFVCTWEGSGGIAQTDFTNLISHSDIYICRRKTKK